MIETMTNALAKDQRCFYFDRLPEDWKLLQLQMSAQQARTNAIGPNIEVNEVVKIFKVSSSFVILIQERLPAEGWDKVRPAMAVTIRANYLIVGDFSLRTDWRVFSIRLTDTLGMPVPRCVERLPSSKLSIVNFPFPRLWTKKHVEVRSLLLLLGDSTSSLAMRCSTYSQSSAG